MVKSKGYLVDGDEVELMDDSKRPSRGHSYLVFMQSLVLPQLHKQRQYICST